jgi:hypothetical protein
MKECATCGVLKPLSEFAPRPERPGGLGVRSSCRDCERERKRRSYADDPEAKLSKARVYFQEKYYPAHKAEIKAAVKRRRKAAK